MGRVVVLETNENVRQELRARLFRDGHEIAECSTHEEAIVHLQSAADVVLVGSVQPSMTAPLLSELRGTHRETPLVVVAVTAEEALEALTAGAFYVARRPVHPEELVLLVQRVLDSTDRHRHEKTRAESPPVPEPVLIGETSAMRGIKDSIRRLCGSPRSSVLIKGESGSGKDTIARAIHFASKREGPFVYVSSLTAPSDSLEVELFGAEPSSALPGGRAGLIERAAGGTLYLNEIAEMPVSVQTRLASVLQDGTFRRVGGSSVRRSDLRVIGASTRNLTEAVGKGTLRPELLYRLAFVTVDVPPLRDRLTDLPLLVSHLLGVVSGRIGRQLRGASTAATELLATHHWPGNVRELENALERAALSSEADTIDSHQVSFQASRAPRIDYHLPFRGIDFEELERCVVIQALGHAKGSQTKAAALLGMTRDQIRYRLTKFRLSSRGEDLRPSSAQLA